MAKSVPHFFKVFFPNQSSNHLRIPPSFRQHIEAETSKRVSLKGPSGSIWNVHLVKDSSELFFEDGWKEFVADQSLVTGDFLVFRYNGDSRFNVLVFDSTACEKEEAFLVRPSGEEEIDVSEGREEVEEEESMGEEDEEKPLIFFKKRMVERNLKRERGNGAILPTDGPMTKKTKQSQTRAVWTNARSKSSSNHRKVCSGTLSITRTKLSPNGKGVSSVRVASLISQRRPITAEEVERAHKRAMSFKSDHPFAIVVMQESYVYSSFFMSIPSLFAREHLPKENTVMTVLDPTDKPWKITYISYIHHGALSGGWGKFSYANNLEKYDACVFELIEKNHLRVHIYRVVEKITPLVRRGRQ